MLSLTLGALVGMILALTGAGGGVLAVPLLVFGLGMRIGDAAPVALIAVGSSAAMGAAMGLRSAHVRYRAALFMAALGLAGSPLGWWLGRQIPNTPLTLLFAAVLAYTCGRMLLRASDALAGKPPRASATTAPCHLDPLVGRLRWTFPCARALGLAGFGTGVLSALLGVGGGFVIVPTLLRATDLDMQSITATSLAIIALISAESIGVYWTAGHALPWETAAPFAAGAVVALVLGRRIARYASGPRLQQLFATVGLIVAAAMALRSAL